jgi:hypothetical protein
MGKFAALAFAIIGFVAVPLSATADPVVIPMPNPIYRSLESGKASHDAGTIRGVIESVDYSSGTFVVKSKGDRQVIAVVPSTAIYRGNEYATLGDLRRGENVQVSVYEIGGRLVAQMIRFK